MYWLGWLSLLWSIDSTKLGFFILAFFLVISSCIGLLASKLDGESDLFKKFHNFVWFSAEAMLVLGMIGTVVGFIIVFGQDFANINVQDSATTVKFLSGVASGVGTALSTTLVGLCCSLMTKFQIIVIENYWE
tara:strand:+ start:523 stop:921 length:399 start_codon:yes stop_codon:yes gene_type:complete